MTKLKINGEDFFLTGTVHLCGFFTTHTGLGHV
jgi:hypothetical protein